MDFGWSHLSSENEHIHSQIAQSIFKQMLQLNKTTLNLSNNSLIAFNTRRNKQLGINEYYDLIYEYKNDCLKAAVEYKKSYYEDGDLKPEEQIYFSLTVIPFGTVNTPGINK